MGVRCVVVAGRVGHSSEQCFILHPGLPHPNEGKSLQFYSERGKGGHRKEECYNLRSVLRLQSRGCFSMQPMQESRPCQGEPLRFTP